MAYAKAFRCLKTFRRLIPYGAHNIPRREQWARANRAYLEALSDDTDLLLSATDNLVALKISAEKSTLNDSLAHAKLLLDAKDARQLFA